MMAVVAGSVALAQASPVVPSPGRQAWRATVAGTVIDTETAAGLPGANVLIEGTLAGASTDASGRFHIANVAAGSYRLSASVVGYRRTTVEITVEEGRDLAVDIALVRAPLETAPIVVTATRRQEGALDIPVAFSVVTPRDIEKVDALSPEEIMRYAPGVVVTDTQVDVRGSGGFTRGAGSRTLLLIDGVPALAGDTGDIKWDLVPPEQIQRIEIIKSAASALYGSSALGGVMNIVTAPVSDHPVTGFHIFTGYFDDPFYREWKWTTEWLTFAGLEVSHTRRAGPLGLFVDLGKRWNDGYRRNSDFDRSSATAKLTCPAGGIQLTFFNAWALEKHGHATEWQSQAEALDIDPAARNDRVRSEKTSGYLAAKSLLGMTNAVSASMNWYLTDWDNDFHDTDDNSRARRLGGTVEVDRIISPRLTVTAGCEGWQTDVRSTMFGNRDTGEIGAFAEAKVKALELALLTLGARYDRHSLGRGRGGEGLVSPRAAVVIRTGATSNINASVGRGFRAPTIAEMFTSTTVGGFTVKPNLDLTPETGISYEIGSTGDLGPYAKAGLGLFRSDYDNLIEPEVDTGDGNLHFTNINDARVSGIDCWVRTTSIYNLASASASYLYLSTKDVDSGAPLAYRSKHSLKVSLDAVTERFAAGVDVIYRSRVERVKVYEDDERVPICTTDLRGEVTLGNFRLSGKVANLFNYNYTEIERSLAPIRSVRFSLRGAL